MAPSSCSALVVCPDAVGLHAPSLGLCGSVIQQNSNDATSKPFRDSAACPTGVGTSKHVTLRTFRVMETMVNAYPDESLSGSLIVPQSSPLPLFSL